MLKILLGTDWKYNRSQILQLVSQDVKAQKNGRILMVPELISHETERRLCAVAGDTASRFAEVLTFSRLVGRVREFVGHTSLDCLDNGGRIVAMAAAVRQIQSRIKAYASVGTKPEFLLGLVEAIDEFKRCCITSADLRGAAGNTRGNLSQKLEELALILESYDSVCANGKRDPRDQMGWLLSELENCSYAEDHVFYIEGFPDFSRQHSQILTHLIRYAPDITVSLNCDAVGSNAMAFERAGKTASDLIGIAKQYGVEYNVQVLVPPQSPTLDVSLRLFQGSLHTADCLRVFQCDTVYRECTQVAQQIHSLVRNGARYREIAVVCADFPAYQHVLDAVFQKFHIPVYLSGTEKILDKSVVATVLAALDTALGGFEREDVLRYLKTSLSPLTLEQCDEIENYAILWSINGSKWIKPWESHPFGLGKEWTEEARSYLTQLNTARDRALTPLINLRNGLIHADRLSDQVQALYAFFEEISLAENLENLAGELDDSGDNRGAQILNQLWEIMISAMEQMYDMLGDSVWDADVFTRLFRILLSQYSVGTIPPVLDAVIAGSVSAMRCQKVRHLFVVGAVEGAFPKYNNGYGVLSGQERTLLRTIGLPLLGDVMDGLEQEFAEIYGVFCGALDTITVSCPSKQSSFIFDRLQKMAAVNDTVTDQLGSALSDESDAAALLVRREDRNGAQALGLNDLYSEIENKRSYNFGRITGENIQKLYGENLRLSASQIDKQALCRFQYFLKYGLNVSVRKPIEVDPAEFGTYVHAVLENSVSDIMKLGGFQKVPLDKMLALVKKHSDNYIADRFSDLDSQRLTYLFSRNSHELEMISRELWRELHFSAFSPSYFELHFDNGAQMPAIGITGKEISAVLRGFVDRVDIWHTSDGDYFRIVDYKTGKKDFDYCDIVSGYGLQMLLYLFALAENGQELVGALPIPAGVQYFPARAPVLSAQGRPTSESAEKLRKKEWTRRGMLLDEADVLNAVEPESAESEVSFTRRSDGTISGNLASREDFRALKKFVFGLLGDMIDEIASGNVEPNPYTRGTQTDACKYCDYKLICHGAGEAHRRNCRAISNEEFWEKVKKGGSKSCRNN